MPGVGMTTQTGGFAFRTTHWSVVLEAQGSTPAAQAALDKICRTYWRPIYGFVRRQRVGPEEAKDLTQGFFALLLDRKSTRLNSSHPSISYAVFCLKKKNKNEKYTTSSHTKQD